MSSIVQKVNGVIASNGDTLSFPVPTIPGNAVVVILMLVGTDNQFQVDPPANVYVTDDGGNVYDFVGNTQYQGYNFFGGSTTEIFAIPSDALVSMQTLTFDHWNSPPLYVWAYEVNHPLPLLGFLTGSSSPYSGSSNNANTLQVVPDTGQVPGDLSPPAPGENLLFAAVAPYTGAIASVADNLAIGTAWTLDNVQNGWAVAYAEIAGDADQQAAFTNSESAPFAGLFVVVPNVGPLTTGNIIVKKVTHPSGSEQGFEFTTDYGAPFTLHDGEQNDSGSITPGTKTITETPVEGWTTVIAALDQDNNPVAIAEDGSFPLSAGETVTITFTNTIQKVIVAKETTPPSSLQDFAFHPSWGADFTLQGGQSNDSGRLEPGAYTITEDPVTGWKTSVAAVDQADNPVTIAEDGSLTLASGQIVTVTFTNERCICLDFTEEVIRDANDIEQVVAGGADGKLYLLYDGISDNGKLFTGEALALKYVGPQRTALQSIEWYGEKSAEFFLAKQLNTPFDSSQMAALCGEDSEGVEEVQDDENSNHWRVTVKEQLQMIHAYLLLRLKGYEGGTMELSDPPHMPVETYGRVLLVSPQAGGANPR